MTRARGFPLAALLGVAAVLLLNVVPMASNDLWLQLRIGQMVAQDHVIPPTLLFPFTPIRDNAFNAHEWLASALFWLAEQGVGERGLPFVQGAFALLQFGLAGLLAWRLCGQRGLALALAGLALLVANYRYVLRPELFALALFVALLLVVERTRAGGRRTTLLWTLPLAVAWANLHGSFLLGPVVLAIVAAGEGAEAAWRGAGPPGARLRDGVHGALPWLAAAVGMLLACVVNPRGAELLRFAFDVTSSQAMRTMIKEWLPTLHPLFMETAAFRVFAVVAFATLGTVIALRRHLAFADALLLAAFTVLAVDRNRHIVWFGFVALAVCARLLGRSGLAARLAPRADAAAAALAAVTIALALAFGNVRGAFPFWAPNNNFGDAMRAELEKPDLRGPVLNSYELGAELIWRDWPRLAPAIDSRIDSYGDAYFLGIQSLWTDEAALLAFVDRFHVDHLLLLRRDFDLGVRDMPRLAAGWHVRLADDRMLLLERGPAPAR